MKNIPEPPEGFQHSPIKTLFVILVMITVGFLALFGVSLINQKTGEQTPPVPPTPPSPTDTATSTVLENLESQGELKKFNTYDEVRAFIESQMGETTTGRGFGSGMAEIMPLMSDIDGVGKSMGVDESIAVSQTAPSDGGGGADYSTTNIQVAGVDEADIVKTDGEYVYIVSYNDLYIVKAYPGKDAEVLAKIAFKSTPQSLYLSDDRLVVYGANDAIYNYDVYKTFRRSSPYTFLKVFDISDKRNPKQLRDVDFEGSYVNSRMIGDYVYILTTTYADVWSDDPIVPRILENGREVSTDSSNPRCNCPDVYYVTVPGQSYQYTSIFAVNSEDAETAVNHQVYLLPYTQALYVSQNNLYLVYTKYISEHELALEVTRDIVFSRLLQKDQDKIRAIEAAQDFILNPSEKIAKIHTILERYINNLEETDRSNLENEVTAALRAKYDDIGDELEKTVIHKIALGRGSLEYKASGEVTGYVLNQFSMDEDKGYFRVATTRSRQWRTYFDDSEPEDDESYSTIYILDSNLKQTGELQKLAPGERIYSVRFMQGRAYLVTFKQTDPLFVVDVSNPRSPRVLGELKIPGFSTYLHPFDENLLIGFGRETAENEWGGVVTKGLKVSLFDVRTVSNPKEIDAYTWGDANTYSPALDDHHAFLFSKEKELLVIPVEELGGWIEPMPMPLDSTTKIMPPVPANFRGAYVFSATQSGFELKGKIAHSGGIFEETQEYHYGQSFWDTTVKRSLYIDELLYTVSNRYLKINELDDLDEVKNVALKKEKGEDFEVVN